MNSGFLDAHNLAWKLALMHHKDDNPNTSDRKYRDLGEKIRTKTKYNFRMLKSFEAERQLAAFSTRDLALTNYDKSLGISKALLLPMGAMKVVLGFAEMLGEKTGTRLVNTALATGKAFLRSQGREHGGGLPYEFK